MCEVARCRTRGGRLCGVAATGASEHLLGRTAAGRVLAIRRTAAWRTKAHHPLRLIPAALLASHVQATMERVLAVQDTTELDYSHHPATASLGPIGNGHGRGMLVHATLAITPNRLSLGRLSSEGVP